MQTTQECICCHNVPEVNQKRLEKDVSSIIDSSGLCANCLDLDVLETSFYEFKELHFPQKIINSCLSKLIISGFVIKRTLDNACFHSGILYILQIQL